jgi:hypothetical protein
MSDILDLATTRCLNETAIRNHALRCSARFRANKFTRVGEDFVEEVKADVEAIMRELRTKAKIYFPPNEALPPDETFTTGLLLQHADLTLNEIIGRIIQNKVQRQPTCGKTLSRTR